MKTKARITCARCGRALTRPDSVERRLGLDCAAKLGLVPPVHRGARPSPRPLDRQLWFRFISDCAGHDPGEVFA